MMPAAIQRMFGSKNGALIYGVIYSAFGIAAIVTMFVSKVNIKFTNEIFVATVYRSQFDLLDNSLMGNSWVLQQSSTIETSSQLCFSVKSLLIVSSQFWTWILD
jgi:hypothetical protein